MIHTISSSSLLSEWILYKRASVFRVYTKIQHKSNKIGICDWVTIFKTAKQLCETRKKNIESKPIKNHFTVNTIESISFLAFECGNFHFFLVNLPSKCVNVWDFEMSVFMSTVNSFITYANQFRRLKLLTQIQTSIDQQNNFCFENFDFCFVS